MDHANLNKAGLHPQGAPLVYASVPSTLVFQNPAVTTAHDLISPHLGKPRGRGEQISG